MLVTVQTCQTSKNSVTQNLHSSQKYLHSHRYKLQSLDFLFFLSAGRSLLFSAKKHKSSRYLPKVTLFQYEIPTLCFYSSALRRDTLNKEMLSTQNNEEWNFERYQFHFSVFAQSNDSGFSPLSLQTCFNPFGASMPLYTVNVPTVQCIYGYVIVVLRLVKKM